MNQHQYPVDVRWGEMDALGHVNNAEYLRYFESARIEWMASTGHLIANPDSGSVVLQTTCRYIAPVEYPCQLNVLTILSKVGNSSFTFSHKLVGVADDKLYTEAEVICVWVDRETGKPKRVPDFIRSLLV
jgi:acyl-CoA thioester hydrolase